MTRKPAKKPTKLQKKLVHFIQQFDQENGYPPTFREMQDQVGISSTSMVNYNLKPLIEMGYLERDPFTSRGLRVVKPLLDEAQNTVSMVRRLSQDLLSIGVAGRIVASKPIPVPSSDFRTFDPETTVEIAASMLPIRSPEKRQIFALQVQGNSMIEDMVQDGDIVIMESVREARNGEMVAVWLADNEETTLKRFYREKDRIRLQPANPEMEPIYIDDSQSIEIQGRVMMIISPMKSFSPTRPN